MLDAGSEHGGAEAQALATPRPSRGARYRILVVEDDDDSRDLLAELLAENGFVVTAVATSAEAATALEALDFHVVLADLDLPEGEGWEVGQLAKRHRPDQAVALMVGCTPAVDEPSRYGVDALVHKPMAPLELVDRLRALAAGAEEGQP